MYHVKDYLIQKFLKDKSGNCYLKSENKKYPIIKLKSDIETIIWGVARYVIHSL